MGENPVVQRKIQLVRIAHIYYSYTDIEKASQFLLDFGFFKEKTITSSGSGDGVDGVERIYFRGYGTEPWILCAIQDDVNAFRGAAFVVESEDDLHLAAEILPGASKVHELKSAPGGGQAVTFRDPVDGYLMHLVHGQERVRMLDIFLQHTSVNYVSLLSSPLFISLTLFTRGKRRDGLALDCALKVS